MFYKVVLAVLVLLGVYVGVSFLQIRAELFKVYDVPSAYTIGPADADLVIVEFVRYNCGLCQQMQAPFAAAMARDGKVRYVPRPIAFEEAHPGQGALVKLNYAAAKQGQFIEAFNYILSRGLEKLDEVELARMSAELGLDIVQLKADMEKPDVAALVKENEDFFEEWGFNSVPVFLMGRSAIYRIRSDQPIPTEDEFIEMFEKARRFF